MRRFLKIFKIRHDAQERIFLMLGVGFFVGIFVAAYTVTAESLFLSRLSDQLDKAFLISGALGVLSTLIFSALQNRIKFSYLTFATFLLIIIFTVLIHGAYNAAEGAQGDVFLFILFCLTGPFTALLLLCYWGIFGRLFNFRQSKKIIGWIDTGQLIAIILTNFLIPVMSSFFDYFSEVSNFLIVCSISIGIATVFLMVIFKRHALLKNDPGSFEKSVREKTKFSEIFKNRYVVLLSGFLIISTATLMFGQFAFQTVINKQYPNQVTLANFLGYFNGTTFALSLLMQTFVNDKILSNYGIKISLFLLPVITGLLAILAIVVPTVSNFFTAGGENTFLLFFLFVALMRLFNSMLRDSLENPVFKLLFIPLDDRYRFGIQAKVEGVVSETGRLMAGAIIFLFALTQFFDVIWVLLLLLVLCAFYMVVSSRLYDGYRHQIRLKLESAGFQEQRLDIGFSHLIKRLEGYLLGKNQSRAVFSFRLLEKINPTVIGSWLNKLMNNEDEHVRNYAQHRMNEFKGLSVSESYVIKSQVDSNGKKVLNKGELELLFSRGGDITKSRIQKLARSPEVRDRQYAAELSLHSSSEESLSFLIELLNDVEEKVRRTAIITSIKRYNSEVINALIDNLSNSVYGNQAMNALVIIGERCLPYLENAFYRSGQLTQTMIRVVQIMGRIGGHRAQELLWNKIDYPDKMIVSQVLLSMGECGFKAGVSQVTRIRFAIESDIADISWNLSAYQEVGTGQQTKPVLNALSMEVQNDIEHIYMLLAMLYDTGSIQLVKEIIEGGTSEGTTYAIELLDVFLSDHLKERVIPVIDDISDTEKINRLEMFYPRVKLDEKLVLKFLINRDFTQTNRWTKACVIYLIGVRRIKEFTLDLIAQLFNPDQMVREVAGWALYQINEALYFQNVERLDDNIKQELDLVVCPQIKTKRPAKLMIYEKVIFFQKIPIFSKVQGLTLASLADIAVEVKLKENDFQAIDNKHVNDFFIVYSGVIQYFEKGNWVKDYQPGQFVGEMITQIGFANSNLLVAKSKALLLRLNKDRFYELLADNVKLADKVLDFV